jgi:hypothetical protein
MDFREYYNLESFLFDKVRVQVAKQGYLTAFDFFCIVIWKANRAKSKIAQTILKSGATDLDEAARKITSDLSQKSTPKERLHSLLKVGFHLPMASAILTVLYPYEFTVYDKRVCDQLGDFHNITNKSNFESLWSGYMDFKQKVEETEPSGLSLRDKDRYLWGKSFCEQLNRDISQGFKKDTSDGS